MSVRNRSVTTSDAVPGAQVHIPDEALIAFTQGRLRASHHTHPSHLCSPKILASGEGGETSPHAVNGPCLNIA